MAVHTKLSKKDILEILKKYNIGKLKKFSGIKEGIENTNYLIFTSKNKFILTIFENRVNKSKIPIFLKLMTHCSNNKINCPNPIRDNNGNLINTVKVKKFGIFSFLNGKSKSKWDDDDCFFVGRTLANFHKKNINRNLNLKNNFGVSSWKKLLTKCKSQINNIIPNCLGLMSSEIDFLNNEWPIDLPSGTIHGDLFPDNVLFSKKKISGILDFYFSCDDILVYDLAITLNAWGFRNGNFKKLLFSSVLQGYETIRKLNKSEKRKLNILLRGASMRFLLTRIYDMIYIDSSKFLNKKNPLEFFKILNFHRNIKNTTDYFSGI
tara:strand:+ start:1628 stop:2590 length:963 start_codon:yes stop_codon:yes gene_type:complete